MRSENGRGGRPGKLRRPEIPKQEGAHHVRGRDFRQVVSDIFASPGAPLARLVGGPTVESCPILPLGRDGRRFFYEDQLGQTIRLHAREHTRLTLIGLFAGQMEWIERNFPKRPGRAALCSGVTFDQRTLTCWLMACCTRAGRYTDAEMQRDNGRLYEALRKRRATALR